MAAPNTRVQDMNIYDGMERMPLDDSFSHGVMPTSSSSIASTPTGLTSWRSDGIAASFGSANTPRAPQNPPMQFPQVPPPQAHPHQYPPQQYNQPPPPPQYTQQYNQPPPPPQYTQQYNQPPQYTQQYNQPPPPPQYTQQYNQPPPPQYTQQYTPSAPYAPPVPYAPSAAVSSSSDKKSSPPRARREHSRSPRRRSRSRSRSPRRRRREASHSRSPSPSKSYKVYAGRRAQDPFRTSAEIVAAEVAAKFVEIDIASRNEVFRGRTFGYSGIPVLFMEDGKEACRVYLHEGAAIKTPYKHEKEIVLDWGKDLVIAWDTYRIVTDKTRFSGSEQFTQQIHRMMYYFWMRREDIMVSHIAGRVKNNVGRLDEFVHSFVDIVNANYIGVKFTRDLVEAIFLLLFRVKNRSAMSPVCEYTRFANIITQMHQTGSLSFPYPTAEARGLHEYYYTQYIKSFKYDPNLKTDAIYDRYLKDFNDAFVAVKCTGKFNRYPYREEDA